MGVTFFILRSLHDSMSLALANAKRAWEIAKLKKLSLIASMTNDTEWQHELCARIEKIEG
ncbi:hypothetical protein ABD71_13925 [Brevibacillus laterosporus]|nr:hypothetical protein [Brevibacillus laterosporus]MBG9774109.1 hypothetical protein [Brevibacillus laterosporus]